MDTKVWIYKFPLRVFVFTIIINHYSAWMSYSQTRFGREQQARTICLFIHVWSKLFWIPRAVPVKEDEGSVILFGLCDVKIVREIKRVVFPFFLNIQKNYFHRHRLITVWQIYVAIELHIKTTPLYPHNVCLLNAHYFCPWVLMAKQTSRYCNA